MEQVSTTIHQEKTASNQIDLLQNQKHVRFISFLSELKLSDEIRSQSKSISDRI